MSDVTFRTPAVQLRRLFAGAGTAAVIVAVIPVFAGSPARWAPAALVPWLSIAGTIVLAVAMGVNYLAAQVQGDAHGIASRTLVRRWSAPWHEITELRVREIKGKYSTARRISVVTGKRVRSLPLPVTNKDVDPAFDADVTALRALHARYGKPRTVHLPVVTARTAGARGAWVGWSLVSLFFLAFAVLTALWVPAAASGRDDWRAVAACTKDTPPAGIRDCLYTTPAVIERATDPRTGRKRWLYFTDDRPVDRVQVPKEGTGEFGAGDRVELTYWHGGLRRITGDGHTWSEHVPAAKDVAVGSALFALLGCYPLTVLAIRLRGRRLPADDVLPSALPFAGVLAATAVWLVPLVYRHPTTLLTSPQARWWGAAGLAVSAGLFLWAWRATRIRRPGEGGGGRAEPAAEGEAFVRAVFLDATDFNPLRFGTHILLGDGTPAVTPGRDRFAARRIPVERLTLRTVRRPRGGDKAAVRAGWHIAEFEDPNTATPVRLAAAPADLTRILREFEAAQGRSDVRTS
ncbi:hypothetical protein SRB5_15090 [Streptomyces sp. RB5]|uniref:PH domain-containing protein n=1 Tax=Streptomyces smaragdinus TaxID=2585196 RepID=A0A7K0CDF7_9ACTN|nr:PH domain-containing protein [Streptomyces smaragdinus]MQY11393.1 hypothetical protein [Streptomyces smaragdinus]